MRLSETTQEYCIKHGHQEFFLGEVWELPFDVNPEFCGEALHCPECHPDHPDNPKVIQAFEEEQERLLYSCMAW